MEIILILVVLMLFGRFFIASEDNSESEGNYTPDPIRCLRCHPNPDLDSYIQSIFHLAEDNGGLWRIDFKPDKTIIHTQNGHKIESTLTPHGYNHIPFAQGKTYTFDEHSYYLCEFPFRLRIAAHDRNAMFWITWENVSVPTNSGQPQTSNTQAIISSLHICSKAYYNQHKPFHLPED